MTTVCDFMYDNALLQVVDTSTHSKGNILDLIITNSEDSVRDLTIHSLWPSDYFWPLHSHLPFVSLGTIFLLLLSNICLWLPQGWLQQSLLFSSWFRLHHMPFITWCWFGMERNQVGHLWRNELVHSQGQIAPSSIPSANSDIYPNASIPFARKYPKNQHPTYETNLSSKLQPLVIKSNLPNHSMSLNLLQTVPVTVIQKSTIIFAHFLITALFHPLFFSTRLVLPLT